MFFFVGILGLMQWLQPKKYQERNPHRYPITAVPRLGLQDRLLKKCTVIVERVKSDTYNVKIPIWSYEHGHEDWLRSQRCLHVLVHRFLAIVFLFWWRLLLSLFIMWLRLFFANIQRIGCQLEFYGTSDCCSYFSLNYVPPQTAADTVRKNIVFFVYLQNARIRNVPVLTFEGWNRMLVLLWTFIVRTGVRIWSVQWLTYVTILRSRQWSLFGEMYE